MSKIQFLLDEYSESHQSRTNKNIHWVCVPLIFWSIMALLYSMPNAFLVALLGNHYYSNWAVLAIIPVLIYYGFLSISLTIGMFGFISACLFISEILVRNSTISLWIIALVVFILAWIGQFYGHKVEGKKPSFLKDIQFLLIGPLWLMHFIYRRSGVKY